MDIVTWLEGLGLKQYAQAFADHGVDAVILPRLTAEDLREIGVGAVGHRRKLLEAIDALHAGAQSLQRATRHLRWPDLLRHHRGPSAGSSR